jgi:hypothetical protein
MLEFHDDAAAHAQEGVSDFRESYYVNFFDRDTDLHGLCWQGVRPHARAGEVVFVLFDGPDALIRSVAMDVPVAPDVGNERVELNGTRWECIEPWAHWRITHAGDDATASVDWHQMHAPCEWDWGPPGARRFEFAGRVHVEAQVGGRSVSFDGFGQRDRAWGPRNYSPIDFSWWTVVQFPDEVAVQAYGIILKDGTKQIIGYLHQDGLTRNIVDLEISGIELSAGGGPPVAARHVLTDDIGRTLELVSCEQLNALTFGTDATGTALTERSPTEGAASRMYLSFYRFTRADGAVANGMIDNNVRHRADGVYPERLHVSGESRSRLLEYGMDRISASCVRGGAQVQSAPARRSDVDGIVADERV